MPITPIQLAEVPGVGAGWEDYQTSTAAAIGHIYNTLYRKGIANIQSPCGANCSFEQRFHGPAHKCSEIDFANIKAENGEDAQNPFCAWPSASDFGPCGAIFVNSRLGKTVDGINWYKASNSSIGSGTQPMKPWQDGKIWVAHQYMLPEYRRLVDNQGHTKDPTTDILPDMFERHMFVCESYNATFKLFPQYLCAKATIVMHRYLNPTNFTVLQETGSMETDNYAAYSIHETLYSLLSGEIAPNGRGVPTDSTHLAMSALVEEMPFPLLSTSEYHGSSAQKPVAELRPLFEQLHFNITVGLLSLGPSLLYAENGTSVGPAEVRRVEDVWVYDPLVLLAVYGLAALGDLLVIIVGVVIMARRNRGVLGFEFARVLAATKASQELVDSVAVEWKDLLDPMPRATGRKRIRWHDGLVTGEDGVADSNDMMLRRQVVGFKLDGEG
ncbi:hypothetical protein QBC37DRAFT_430415 [Rhypophila decipiens]|uniref:Uncharacterized protein n=1 Tax=Rhypophila decipiens TaxID=261697 RepID=A0AAN6Y147_9PEZI|nr:hypothetical protein QBC37DRAFT_430415 [Rhypophila decipiens]